MIMSHPPLTYSARRDPNQPVLLDLVTRQDLPVHLVVSEPGHTSASKRTGLLPFAAWAPSNTIARNRHALSTGLEPWRAIHAGYESRSCPSRIFRMRSGGDRRRGFVLALILGHLRHGSLIADRERSAHRSGRGSRKHPGRDTTQCGLGAVQDRVGRIGRSRATRAVRQRNGEDRRSFVRLTSTRRKGACPTGTKEHRGRRGGLLEVAGHAQGRTLGGG